MAKTALPSNPDAATHLFIVMGVSGSGKSTLAERIARHYRYTYLDADDFHSQEAKALMASGVPLTDTLRGPWVDNIRARLQQALSFGENSVLAFSGLRQAHRQALRDIGLKTLVLFLTGDEKTIQERVNLRSNHFMNPRLIHSQFEALEEPLNEADVICIDIQATPDQVFKQAISSIELALTF